VCSSTNSGINSMELITPAAVPYILPLIQTELVDAGYQFTCWNFHICNQRRECRLCCSISSLTAANTEVTRDPTVDNCFAIASKTCVIFYDTVHNIQINLKPTQSFEAFCQSKGNTGNTHDYCFVYNHIHKLQGTHLCVHTLTLYINLFITGVDRGEQHEVLTLVQLWVLGAPS